MRPPTSPHRTRPPREPAAPADDGRLAVRIPVSALTLAGFRAWATSEDFPDHVRAAFLGSEVYLDMSNEEPETHVSVKGEISRVMATLVREQGLGKFYADGLLVSNEQAEVSNNPDGTFITWEGLETGRARLVPRAGHAGQYAELEGTPDWVLEVVSDSSVDKDTERLRRAYHAAGIPEYWLVDARGEEVVFQILLRRKAGYVAAPVKDGWQRSRVFGRSFRLGRSQGRRGLWEYTLEVRP